MSLHLQMKTELGNLDVFETSFVGSVHVCWVVFGNYCKFVLSLCYFCSRDTDYKLPNLW